MACTVCRMSTLAWTLVLVALHFRFGAAQPQRNRIDINYKVERKPGDKYYRGRISDQDYLDMYQKWVDTGLSSLMSAIAEKKLKRQRRSVADRFGECSAQATDVPKHARCVSLLLREQIGPAPAEKGRRRSRLTKYRPHRDWTGAFRTGHARRKRSTKARKTSTYSLSDRRPRLSPLGGVARLLLDSMRTMRNRTELPHWKQTVERIRANGAKRLQHRRLVEEDSEEAGGGGMTAAAFRRHLAPESASAALARRMADLDPAALAADPRQLDRWLGARRSGAGKEERLVEVIRQAMKLAYGLAGHNTTGFERKNIRVVSPRFLGVTKEDTKDDEISLISPSLFSLHNEGEGVENLTSIPTLLKGIGDFDRDLWLDLVMEAAGVNEESDKLEAQVRQFEYNRTASVMTNITNLVDEDGTPLYATKKNMTDLGFDKDYIELFEKLHSNYSREQLHEMNTTGYSVLSREQLELLYGPASPHRHLDAYERLAHLSRAEVQARVHADIHRLADMRSFSLRARDVVLAPVVLSGAAIGNPVLASQPFTLSPIVLTPIILSPAIFGPVVLSPWLFVPVVLSPRILGTLVLSPFALSPLVLSPFALHPAVLSPGLLSPIILSPLLLLPLILSPQCFTPIILSPMCLAPVILNPMVGSPIVLSPFVLSPLIASPQVLGALILSPYALSPVVYSPLAAFIALLSPSWLS